MRGISLIEILVAILISLIATVVIFSVLDRAEHRKRTTVASGDAEISGAAAAYALERELKQAGFGFGRSGVLGCDVAGYNNVPGTAGNPPGPVFNFPLVPVRIVQGPGGASDTIEILRGSSALLNDPVPYALGGVERWQVMQRAGFIKDDFMIAASGSGATARCELERITGVPTADPTMVYREGDSAHPEYSPFNRAAPLVGPSGILIGLGATPQRASWSIANGRLVRADVFRGPHVQTRAEQADLVVDLQAQYGYDDVGPPNGRIESAEWVDTLPANPDWTRVIAIRFALLGRSAQFEREKVPQPVPSWANGEFVMTNIDGTADSDPGGTAGDPNNWRNYRHRVYELVVPLRNLIWGRST